MGIISGDENFLPKLSISVPIYNVEQYLRQCIESLLAQTLKEIEIILVDDGSPDSCGEICDSYLQKDDRIIVIHKENGGLASARQAALEVARGEYFCACDADDWVDPEMYYKLYTKAKATNSDIVMCDYIENHSSGEVINKSFNFESLKGKDYLSEILLGRFPHIIWNKIIKLDLFKRYNLTWEQGINQGEDMLMCMKLFRHKISLESVSKPLYHYRIVESGNSYTQNITMSSFNQSCRVVEWAEHNISEESYKKGLVHMRVNLSITGLRVKKDMTAEIYNKMVMSKLPFSDIIQYEGFTRKGLVAIITKLLGYPFGRMLIRLFY